MGNANPTLQNRPDSFSDIYEDILQHDYPIDLLGEGEIVSPTVSDHLLNWMFSKPTNTFSFDSYNSNLLPESKIHSLGDEMMRIVDEMAVTEEEAQHTISLIVDDLEAALKNQNVPRLWQCFGSYQDGLCCKNSDIDLYYPLDGSYYSDGILSEIGKVLGLVTDDEYDAEPIPRRIERLLRQSQSFAKVFYIETAKVPIIKLVHRRTGKDVDITFNKTGIMNTQLMKFYISLNPNVKYLTLYLKHLLSRYDLHGTNKITTTILFWLVVYFMQQKSSLLSVLKVREAARDKHYDRGWDYSVPTSGTSNESNSSPDSGILFLLLRDFLKYYRDYNFSQNVICPLVGYDIPIFEFKNLQFPFYGFSVYVNKVRSGEIDCFPISYINLQDPTILGNNLAKQTNENTINKFKILCHYAYDGLSDFSSEYRTRLLREYLPFSLRAENRWHQNLIQYTALRLKYQERSQTIHLHLGPRYILSVIRAMMVGVFQFQCDYIVPMNDDRKRNDSTSCTYFEFSADSNTWTNYFIRRIYKIANIPADVNVFQQPISVYILCEIDMARKYLKIILQSELHLHNFLKRNMYGILAKLFEGMIEFVPTAQDE